ncbi:MAG: uncharacterized protein QOK40_1064 [Miltoncostaeaceae bacterium]|nr:uncharacterized protein [Miltoncostaeaceae bacterium]
MTVRALACALFRSPVPGRAKTRLCPPLAPHEAAALALAFLLDLLDGLGAAAVDREVCAADAAARPLLGPLLPPGVALAAQPPGDLGARMRAVSAGRLAAGRPAVVLVGADCPTLGPGPVRAALDALAAGADAALCPAADGGYSLIALARPHPELFRAVPWSSAATLAVTRRRARDAGLRLVELDRIDDVDRPADLVRLAGELAAAGSPSPAPRTRALLHRLGYEVGPAGLRATANSLTKV